MSIFVDETTKVIYQGLTGSQGSYYGRLNREYGTQVVAGTHPKKAGTDVDGVPIYANVAEAVGRVSLGCRARLGGRVEQRHREGGVDDRVVNPN